MKIRICTLALLLALASVSCHRKTKAECEADYKKAVKSCDTEKANKKDCIKEAKEERDECKKKAKE